MKKKMGRTGKATKASDPEPNVGAIDVPETNPIS